jgi:hypothetical protein
METREQQIAELMSENEKLQYDEGDEGKIFDRSQHVTQSFINLLGATATFRDELAAEVDTDSAAKMSAIRQDMVEAYVTAMYDLYRLGITLRISDEALTRYLDYLKGPEDKPLVMAGL